MNSDIRFVREFIFDRFGVFDKIAAQAVRYWNVFSRSVVDADRYLCSGRIMLCRRFGVDDMGLLVMVSSGL